MSERRLVLHVGAHKTGTSLVQKFLRDRPEFRERNAITYMSRSESAEWLGWGEKLADDPRPFTDRLRELEATAPGNSVVLSNENLLGRPFVAEWQGLYPGADDAAASLAAATLALAPRVVFYVRPLAEFVESYYLQTIHQGFAHDFATWSSRYDLSAVSWQPAIDALDRRFGRDNVVVGDFAEIRQGQEEFLRGFFGRAGLDCEGDLGYTHANPSISARGLAMALEVNGRLQDFEERRAMRKFLQRHFSNRDFERARPLPPRVRELLDGIDTSSVDRRLEADRVPTTDGLRP